MGERQFGPYHLVHQIAVGGMAEIHLAKTGGIAGFEKYVALKMIHPNFSQDEQFIQMLIDEAKITVQLQHVNVAQTFDLGRVSDTYYITMEYVNGGDLYQILRRGSEQGREMPVDVAAFITKEVATGLDYAHRKRDHSGRSLGIVHRDVSPQNVLISHAGEVKLVNFGIAKATMRARQTAVGVIKGKYYYMSPEQAWGDRVDHRTDIFSCGILLYEMLTGQMLYLEEDVTKLLDMVRKAEIDPPTVLRPDVPPQLERIVMHALSKKKGDRYRTAGEYAADLERFLHVYSPVFTASKLGRYAGEVLEVDATPPPIEPATPPPPMMERPVTRPLNQEELVRDRSEFKDENSVIFRVDEMARGASRSAYEVDEDADTVAPSRPPIQPRMPHSSTTPFADDFSDDRTVVDDAPPIFDFGAAEPVPPPSADTLHEGLDEDTTSVHAVAPPRLDRDDTPSSGTVRVDPSLESPDDDAPTIARPLPLRPANLATVADAEAPTEADSNGVSLAADDDILEAATVRESGPDTATPGTIPDLLAARVPRPAVSELRPPRASRRTPMRGVPIQAPPTERPQAPLKAPPDGPQTSPPGASISALIDDAIEKMGPTTGVGSRSTQGKGAPAGPQARTTAPPVGSLGGTSPTPGTGVPQAGISYTGSDDASAPVVSISFEQRQLDDLEINEIPDSFKLARAGVPRWVWRVLLAVGCIAISVGIGLVARQGPTAPSPATIQIVSIPDGARVTVNGVRQPGETGASTMSIQTRAGATHVITVEKEGFQLWRREATIKDRGGDVQVIARLLPILVNLTVRSVPTKAEVFLNNRSVGRTPLDLRGLEPVSAQVIELRAKNHRPERRELSWKNETEKTLNFKLKQ